ncbi:MAG: NYN domain-containing protein [Candidatus Omnitrophica bacterium]|nr:NYN domain-containing protein [Candidatus Omnitrophota bacterium]
MEYIIDGLNAIKSSFIKKFEEISLEKSKDFLIDILERYKRKHPSIDFTVVFDGFPSQISFHTKTRIKIIYSHDITADEKIRKIIENKKNKKQIFIVSDDRQIREFTKIIGANPLKVMEFFEIVYPIKKKEKIMKEKEIDDFIKVKIEKELENFYGEKIKENRGKNMEVFRRRR